MAAGALVDRCTALFDSQRLPGLAVAVVRRGAEPEYALFGNADVERRWPVTADTVFRIGSVGKTMTAIAVLQLVEAGRVGLDDAVNKHLRSFAITAVAGARDVTVKDLLTHTGGLGPLRRTTDLVRPLTGLAAGIGEAPTLDTYYRDGLRGQTPPGTRWSYANHGFATLGQLVSDVSGEPFADYLARHVFAPLGMSSTSVRLRPDLKGRLAVGYAVKKKGFTRVKFRDIIVEPAGAVFSTPRDMSRYAEALLGGGANSEGRVLEPESVALMMRRHFTGDERLRAGFGLGVMVTELAGHRSIWHTGGWPGFGTMMNLFPDDGGGVLIFANTLGRTMSGVWDGVARVAHAQPEDAQVVAGPPGRPQLAPPLAGTYAPPEPFVEAPIRWALGGGGGFKVVSAGGRLHLRARLPIGPARKPVPMQQSDGDPFVFDAVLAGRRIQLAFRRDDDGAVSGLCVDGLMSFRKL